MTTRRDGGALLSGRLMRALTAEARAMGIGGTRASADGEGADAAAARRQGDQERKGRLEAISLLVRTLEKVVEFGRLEAAQREDGGDAAEAERLRAEMLRRLRALDARRREGLFDVGPGAAAGAV